MNRHLNSKQHYIDLHDILTIESCLRFAKSLQKELREVSPSDLERKNKVQASYLAYNFMIWFEQVERFKKKKLRIQEWMDKNEAQDKRLREAKIPNNACCDCCNREIEEIDRDLHDWDDQKDQVLFMFRCKPCQKNIAYYEDGNRYIPKPDICPKCKVEYQKGDKKRNSKRKFIITTTCSHCNFQVIDDFETSRQEFEKKENNRKILLQKYRNKYCYSENEGLKQVSSLENLKQMGETIKKWDKDAKDPIRQKVNKIPRLSVVKLKSLLSKKLLKQKYETLSFEDPELDRHVVVPFTVNDVDEKRLEYDSRIQLQRLLREILKNTNWRLMSDGIRYRLGVLSGRLKGYESDDDLYQLLDKKK